MGIVKIRHRGAWNTNREQQCSRTSSFNEDTDDSRDDSELADIGCELAMVGDRICNVPYELYDLSTLEEILSLEAWNSCLTEDERFYLTAYLPDTDQDTFARTIKELLRGCSLFFGSPLEKFFHNLKGGFYSLQATRIRNGLDLLRKREYYHLLRLYHENLAERFVDMRKAWSTCGPNTSVEERVQIWNRRDRKPVLLVDLNSFPADEESSAKCENAATNVPLPKKTKFVDLNSAAVNAKAKGKGLLKVRPVEMHAMQNHFMQPSVSYSTEPCFRPPKGVLKIKPKYDLERPMTTASALENVGHNLPFLECRVSDGKTLSSRYRDESLNTAVRPVDPQSFRRRINTFHESGHNAEPPEGTFPLKSNPTPSILSNPADRYVKTPIHSDVSETVAKISDIGADKLRMVPQFLDYPDHRHGDRGDEALRMTSASMFPITYKRKKSYTKSKVTEALQQTEKAKSVKINVKGWNDHALYNEGLRNVLQHGSPST